jgi:hypothetical protein
MKIPVRIRIHPRIGIRNSIFKNNTINDLKPPVHAGGYFPSVKAIDILKNAG